MALSDAPACGRVFAAAGMYTHRNLVPASYHCYNHGKTIEGIL